MDGCDGCRWHEYEKDTGFHICHLSGDEDANPEDCPYRYPVEDAKADAKYRDSDRY